MRLDVYLAMYYPEHSRSVWQRYILAGYVRVGGEIQTVAKTTLGEDDEVTFTLPNAPNFSNQTLPVLYQDDNVIVIDKPTGILTHSKGALNDEFTVAEFARPLTTYKADTNRPGIVHRLDRDTSGVMILARNDETAALLQRQFSERTVKKTYIAVTDGIPKEPTAIIDAPIARNPKAPSTFRVDPKGKSATTRYEIRAVNDKRALVILQPKTGRTHQLRVHLDYIGTPIHGDRVYGKEADRLYLHAHTLEVTLPGGVRKVFTSDVPSVITEGFEDTDS